VALENLATTTIEPIISRHVQEMINHIAQGIPSPFPLTDSVYIDFHVQKV